MSAKQVERKRYAPEKLCGDLSAKGSLLGKDKLLSFAKTD